MFKYNRNIKHLAKKTCPVDLHAIALILKLLTNGTCQNVQGSNFIEVHNLFLVNDEKSHIFRRQVGSGRVRHTWKK